MDLQACTMADLVDEFVACATRWGGLLESVKKRDQRLADAMIDRNVAVMREMKARGQEGLDALAALMDAESPFVRMKAANYLLNADDRAVALLEELGRGTDELAWHARATLEVNRHYGYI